MDKFQNFGQLKLWNYSEKPNKKDKKGKDGPHLEKLKIKNLNLGPTNHLVK